jgi:hypothetical protein
MKFELLILLFYTSTKDILTAFVKVNTVNLGIQIWPLPFYLQVIQRKPDWSKLKQMVFILMLLKFTSAVLNDKRQLVFIYVAVIT